MKHTKQLFMILLVVFLLVGLGTLAATEVTKNDTTVTKTADLTKTNTVNKDTVIASKTSTTTKNQDNTKIVDSKPNSKTDENLKNKPIQKINSEKETKTATTTVNANNLAELNSAFRTGSEEVIININSNINIENQLINLNSTIKKLTINGNNKKLYGNNFDFLYYENLNNLTINNLKFEQFDIVLSQSTKELKVDNCEFINNNYAIYEEGTKIIINNTKFVNNKKGAIHLYEGSMRIDNSLFDNNTKYDGSSGNHYAGLRGGAIFIHKVNLTISKSNLTNNYAREAGAIATSHLFNTTTIIDECIFKNNTGYTQIYVSGDYSYPEMTKLFINNSYFSDSEQAVHLSSGHLFINNSHFERNEHGLGIYESYINVDNCTFNNNKAAISNRGSSKITNSKFINNSNNGTSDYTISWAIVGSFSDNSYYKENFEIFNCEFINNSAKTILTGPNSNSTVKNCTFIENQGSTILSVSDNSTITDSKFYKNQANSTVVHGTGYTNITKVNFTNNNGTRIIYCNYGSSTIKTRLNYCNFLNNTATTVIYNSGTEIENSNFTNNRGTIIYIWTDTLKLSKSNFIDNCPSDGYFVINLTGSQRIYINNNYFRNNTNNRMDMLFSNVRRIEEMDIHDNIYINNYLNDTIIPPQTNVITDNQNRALPYEVKVDLRKIYNDTVQNGTLRVYVNGVFKNSYAIDNGGTNINIRNSDLTQRENEILLNYTGLNSLNKHYQNNTAKFTITKVVNTSLSIQAPTFMYSEDFALINITLVDVNGNYLNDEILSVFVDEQEVARLVTSGNGKAVYPFTASGDELTRIVVTHHTTSDSMYASAPDALAEIDVQKIEPEIYISADEIIALHEATITVRMVDHEGNPIRNKNLTINITEQGITLTNGTLTTNNNGIATFKFTPVDDDVLWVNVTYPGDNRYHYVSEAVEIAPGNVTTNTEIIATSTKINVTNTITVKVFAANNAKVNGTAILNINGDKHEVRITGGEGIYTNYKSANAGEKLVTANFTPSDRGYGHSIGTEEFDVEKLPTTLTITVINQTAGNVTLKVIVKPEDNIDSIVTGGRLIIQTVNGNTRTTIYNNTLNNGELIFKPDINEVGWHDFVAEYLGDEYFYGEANNTGIIEVIHVNTATRTYDKTAKVGDKITLNATVTDENGNKVNNGKVSFFIDDQQLYHPNGEAVEANLENGIATTQYTLPTSYTNNTYKIIAKYVGNNKYKLSEGESTLSINLQETDMQITPLNTTLYNTTIKVSLTSITDNNNPIKDAQVIIFDKDGNKLGESITDENGDAVILLNLPTGTQEITISYPGDNVHKSIEKPLTITVTPRESTTTAEEPINTIVGQVLIPITTLDSENNDPVSGGNITITLPDGTVVAKVPVNPTGTTDVPVNLQNAGNYDLTINYSGDENYKPSQTELNNFKVDKIPTQTQVEVLDTTLTNVTIKITTTNNTKDKVTTGTITILNQYNIPFTGLENVQLDNGEATIKIPVAQAGNLKIKVLYNENDIYNSSYALNETGGEEINLEVRKIPTITNVEVLDTTLSNVTIKVTTTNNTGDKVSTGTITILNQYNIPITGLENVQLDNGEATVKIPSQQVGESIIIKVVYNENEIYNSSYALNETGGENIILPPVTKIPTNMNTTVNNGTPSQASVNVTLSDNVGKPIPNESIIVIDKNGNKIGEGTTGQDGKVNIPLDIQEGTHDITIIFPGNEIYKPVNTTQSITIKKHDVTIEPTLEDDKITIKTKDEDEKPIPNLPIVIEDKNGNKIGEGTTDENGGVIIPLDLEPGDYTITIITPGNKDNKPTEEPVTISIPPKETNMTIKTNNGTSPSAYVKLTDDEGNPINTAPITVNDKNGKKIGEGTTGSDGSVTIPLDIPVGTQDITVTYPGNRTHKPATNTTSITRNKNDPKINVVVDSDGTTKVNVTDEKGNSIPGLPVTITDETGKVIGKGTTGPDGTITIPTTITPGPHNVTVSTPGNENNNPSQKTVQVVIPPKDTKINATIPDPTVGNTTVKVNLTDDTGNPIQGVPVIVTLPNGTKVNATTKPNGTVEIPIDIPAGQGTIKVEYPGNQTYKPVAQNINVNVQKIPTTTTTSPTSTQSGNVILTGTVTDKYGKPVNEGNVNIMEANNIVGTGTVNNGRYTIKTNIANKGTHNLRAQYTGTDTYLPSSSNTQTVTVTGQTPTITVQPEGNKVGKINITATLKDPAGKPITGATITVTLPNGTKTTAKTDDNGNAKIPVDTREGTTTVNITYDGNGTYNPVNTRATFTTTKNTPVIRLNPVKGVIGEKITLTAYLNDADGTPITGGNLAFKLNGKTLRSDGRFDSNAPAMKFTVKDGKVTYTINADLYLRNAKNLTAAYSGNYKYTETPSPTVEAQIQKRYAGVTLTVTPTWNKQYDTIKFTATVRDTTKNGKNNTLINQNTKVMFKVNGNTLRDNKGQIIYVPVNSNKQATYNYVVPAGTGGITASKAVRDYKVDAIFVGDNYYPGARNNSKFNVERSATYVNITQARVTSGNLLSVKATLKDFKGNNLIGTNKVTIKINGKNYVDPKNGKAKYWSVKNGVVDLTGIAVDPKTTIKRVMIVIGERQAYTEGRAETTNIVRA